VLPKPATRAREKTAFQLQRAEQIYDLFVTGSSTRRIVAELTTPGPDGAAPRFAHLDRGTVLRDIREERQRRVEKDGEKSELHRADAVALYGIIKERALADESCSHLFEALKAQERIDRILGIDQPVKLDIRLGDLWAKIDAGLLSLGDDHR
jgi:hypothetical protein